MAMARAAGRHEQHKATGKGNPQEKAFVSWARENAVPFQPASPHITGGERTAIEAIVKDARVVALGESAHGVHEPLAFRNRLFRFLVEERGFTAIFLETGFTEARLLNNYVLGGAGDARDVSRRGFTWGFGSASENLELIQWLRAHNEKTDQKVRVYGIDLTGGDGGEIQNASLTLDAPLALIKKSRIELADSTRQSLEAFLPRFSQKAYLSFSVQERAQFHIMLRDLAQVINRDRTELIAVSSGDDYEFARRDVVVAHQIEKMFAALPAEEAGGGLSPEFHRPASVRDAAMAANVMWALQREGARGRVLIFAHNAHIMNAPLHGGIWSAFRKPAIVMGRHLRTKLGNSLRIIATSSAVNGPDLSVSNGRAGSVDEALHAAVDGSFIIDIRRKMMAKGVRGWVRTNQTLRANLTTETAVSPSIAFDAIVYFSSLSRSKSEPR